MSLRESVFGGSAEPRAPRVKNAETDDLVTAISCERRRIAAQHVAGDLARDDVITLGELVEHVAAVEYGVEFTSQERKRVYISFVQNHCETLVDIGVLEPVGDREHIYRRGPNAEGVAAHARWAEASTGGGNR